MEARHPAKIAPVCQWKCSYLDSHVQLLQYIDSFGSEQQQYSAISELRDALNISVLCFCVQQRWQYSVAFYTLPLIDGALSDAFVWRLSVWHLSVAYIGPKLRAERSRKTKIGMGSQRSHVIRTPLLRSKGEGHQTAFLIVALMCQSAVSVGTYWAWITTATLWCARRR